MKKNIFYLFLITGILIGDFLLYRSHSAAMKKIENTNQAVIRLTEKIENCESGYKKESGEIRGQIDTLAGTIAALQLVSREQTAGLKAELLLLEDDFANANRNFAGKYTSLKSHVQELTEVMIPPLITPDPALRTLPTPFPEDVKLSRLFSLGKEAFEKGEFSLSREAFKALLDITPPIWEAHLYYARAAYAENPGKTAGTSTIGELLANLPEEWNQTGEVSRLRGLMALEAGNYIQALPLMQDAVQRNGADPGLLFILGEAAFLFGDSETCVTSLQEILARFPGSPEAEKAEAILKKQGEA